VPLKLETEVETHSSHSTY